MVETDPADHLNKVNYEKTKALILVTLVLSSLLCFTGII